jgi:hypothetical protein
MEGSARFLIVEGGEKGVVFGVVDATGMQAFCKDTCQRSFSDAKRSFDDDELRRLRAGLRLACAFRRRIRTGHFASGSEGEYLSRWIIAVLANEVGKRKVRGGLVRKVQDEHRGKVAKGTNKEQDQRSSDTCSGVQ